MESIHSRGVIHRDLKPENILTGRDHKCNVIYMIDFGISKVFRDNKGRHISFRDKKSFIGTTRYASTGAH
jgi:serine/threonine protein kinase